jgi:hypothetical protein
MMTTDLLQIIRDNEQEAASGRDWFAQAPADVREHIWDSINQVIKEAAGQTTCPAICMGTIARLARLKFGELYEQELREKEA